MIAKGVHVYPHGLPALGQSKLVAEFFCKEFIEGDEQMCHQAKGVLKVQIVGCRETTQWLAGGGDYTYVEKQAIIAKLWEASVTLQLPWGCCDDWEIEDDFHNPLGLDERDAHDLVETTGICNALAELIEEKEKAYA